MKERPILFSTDMVKDILEDRKTQTRRVIKDPRRHSSGRDAFLSSNVGKPSMGDIEKELALNLKPNFPCPYGQVGDRLGVKETHYRWGHWVKNGFTKTGRQKWTFKADGDEVRYCDNPPEAVQRNSFRGTAWYKRPSIFLPKKYIRIWLEITELRVERLQEITGSDVLREGFPWHGIGATMQFGYRPPLTWFVDLWDSLNAKRKPTKYDQEHGITEPITPSYAWASNPWVWVIEFKRYEQ